VRMYYEFARQGRNVGLFKKGILGPGLRMIQLYYEFPWLGPS
jgi:hypothetical protein